MNDRYPESYWHSLNIGSWLLAPGPAGPVGTARLEVFREGLQECEARIAIEDALTNPALKGRLGDELAKRAQETLDERQLAIWKGRGATEQDFKKFGLEVATATDEATGARAERDSVQLAFRHYAEIAEALKNMGPAGEVWCVDLASHKVSWTFKMSQTVLG